MKIITDYFDIINLYKCEEDEIYTNHPEYIDEIVKYLHPNKIYYINPYEFQNISSSLNSNLNLNLDKIISKYPNIEFVNILTEEINIFDNNNNFQFDDLYLLLCNDKYYINANNLYSIIYDCNEIKLKGNIHTLIIDNNSTDDINLKLSGKIDKIKINKCSGTINLNINNLSSNNNKFKIIFKKNNNLLNQKPIINIHLDYPNTIQKIKSNIEYNFYIPCNNIRHMKYIENVNFVDQSDILISDKMKYIRLNSISRIKLFVNEYEERYVINQPDLFNYLMNSIKNKNENKNIKEILYEYDKLKNNRKFDNVIYYQIEKDRNDLHNLIEEDKIINYEQYLDYENIKFNNCTIYSKINIGMNCKNLILNNCKVYSKINLKNISTSFKINDCENMMNDDIIYLCI